MILESVQIKGFRCFDHKGQCVKLDKLTCLVGPNASGKTAVMAALSRVFGETQRERTIEPTDFHLAAGKKLREQSERTLSIEVRIGFPELDALGGIDSDTPSISESFNQMVVEAPDATPYCRIRLEASWLDDGTPTGEVRQWLWWILTPSTDEAVEKEHRQGVRPNERARVRVVYIPALRDPAVQIRGTNTSMLGRLLRALEWAGKDEDLRSHIESLNSELGGLPGISALNLSVQESWNQLYDGRVAANVAFESIATEPEELLRRLAPTFAPNEVSQNLQTDELSDGLRSLFSISLPLGLFGVEERLRKAAEGSGFKANVVDSLPLLTLFAVEEPENHLSPHYLGKIVHRLYEITTLPTAQVVLSSHAPSILRRVNPDHVRYCLGGETRNATEVRLLDLPQNSKGEEFKYVREAVRGYPELYFSRLVILGEGPSEEIVLRRMFEASDTPLDSFFISIVPLGGRHVNHFWRLLKSLGIPFITLLDLDREKEGGGWGRIQYVRDQLVKLHGAESDAIKYSGNDGSKGTLADPIWDTLGEKCPRKEVKDLEDWIAHFQNCHGVFFSSPLDLDFSMLGAFPAAYRSQAPAGGGPRISAEQPRRSQELRQRMRAVLASDSTSAPNELGNSYTACERERFAWYKYLFVDGSKPVAHMRAMVSLTGGPWLHRLPSPLGDLLKRARSIVGAEGGGAEE